MGIHKKTIPENHWNEFCEAFSRQHRGWYTEISDVTPGSARRVLARQAPLRELELTWEATPRSESARDEAHREIRVALEATDGQEATELAIPRPRSLKALSEADGAHAGLEVDAPDGDVIELRFGSSARLESVDGIV